MDWPTNCYLLPMLRRNLNRMLFVFSALGALSPNFVWGHPGHEGGHDLTWDFAGGALSSPLALGLLTLVLGLSVWGLLRHVAKERSSQSTH